MTEVSPSHILPACRHLSSADVESISSHPFAAGGFSDIHDATLDGQKVALKFCRHHLMSDASQIAKVHRNYNPRCVIGC